MVIGADLVAAMKRRTLTPIEAFGFSFFIRGLTGPERVILIARQRAGDPLLPHEVVGMGACDENGAALLTPEQVDELRTAGMDAEMIRVSDAILDASGLTAASQEEAEKN